MAASAPAAEDTGHSARTAPPPPGAPFSPRRTPPHLRRRGPWHFSALGVRSHRNGFTHSPRSQGPNGGVAGRGLPKAGEEGLLRAFLFAPRVPGSAGCPWPVHTALTPLTALGILPPLTPGCSLNFRFPGPMSGILGWGGGAGNCLSTSPSPVTEVGSLEHSERQ